MKIAFALIVVGVFLYWFNQDLEVQAPSTSKSFQYIVKYPQRSSSRGSLPMLVALHGNGDTAENFFDTALDMITAPSRIILLRAPIAYAGGRAWPMSEAELLEYGEAVKEVVQKLQEEYPTRGKPVLFGFSGGAVMTFYQALQYNDDYSMFFAVSGKLPIDSFSGSGASLSTPVYAFHGNQDDIISFRAGEKAVEFLRERDIEVDFREFDTDHLGVFSDMKESIADILNEKLEG